MSYSVLETRYKEEVEDMVEKAKQDTLKAVGEWLKGEINQVIIGDDVQVVAGHVNKGGPASYYQFPMLEFGPKILALCKGRMSE